MAVGDALAVVKGDGARVCQLAVMFDVTCASKVPAVAAGLIAHELFPARKVTMPMTSPRSSMTGAPALVFGRGGITSSHSPASSEKRPVIFSSSTTDLARSTGLRTTATLPPMSGNALTLGTTNGNVRAASAFKSIRFCAGVWASAPETL